MNSVKSITGYFSVRTNQDGIRVWTVLCHNQPLMTDNPNKEDALWVARRQFGEVILPLWDGDKGEFLGEITTSPKIIRVLNLISLSRSRPSIRLLDVLYGPISQPLRADVAGMLLGRKVTKSSKEAQYGNLRKALLSAVGASGNCIASEDADFEDKAKALLNQE